MHQAPKAVILTVWHHGAPTRKAKAVVAAIDSDAGSSHSELNHVINGLDAQIQSPPLHGLRINPLTAHCGPGTFKM
jgi:hypothetical protein